MRYEEWAAIGHANGWLGYAQATLQHRERVPKTLRYAQGRNATYFSNGTRQEV